MRLLRPGTLRRVAGAFGAVAVVLGLWLSVSFIPYPLFPHHLEAAGFSLCADHEIPESFKLRSRGRAA